MADVDLLVVNTVNAPWRRHIDAATLAACLTGAADASVWEEHVRTFFEDVPREAMYRFIHAHGLAPSRLRATYHSLFSSDERCHGDLDAWLDELAGAA